MRSTNQKQDGLWTIQFGELGATLKALQDNGVTKEHLARLRAEPDYAKRVAKFMLQDDLIESTCQKLVRKIMGKNFFGIEEWSFFYGVNFSKKQLREVAKFPWSEDVLNAPCPFHKGKSVKETHFAFLGLNKINGEPLTILKWQELHRAWFRSYHPGAWCAEEKFATEQTCAFRWYLMLLEIVPNSTNKTFQEQTAMLPADYEVPLAIEEVTKLILYRRKNSVFLNRLEHGRCQDTIFGCYPVSVGGFSSRGFHITRYWDSGFYYGVGLAASRKL